MKKVLCIIAAALIVTSTSTALAASPQDVQKVISCLQKGERDGFIRRAYTTNKKDYVAQFSVNAKYKFLSFDVPISGTDDFSVVVDSDLDGIVDFGGIDRGGNSPFIENDHAGKSKWQRRYNTAIADTLKYCRK